jgi:hypothetical protein
MAAAGTLWRLHFCAANSRTIGLKSAAENCGSIAPQLPRELPKRGRFVLPARVEPEAGYPPDDVAIMSVMHPSAPLDRAAQFQALAMRERFERLARRWAARHKALH